MSTPFVSAIVEGLHAVNRNWQLVLVQLAFTMFSFISFFLVVGVPVAVAFIIFGLDLTDIMRDDVLGILRQSTDLLQKYFGMAVMILLSILVYLVLIIGIWVFTIAGTVGALARTISDGVSRFSAGAFLAEGRRLFFPFLLFTTVVGILFGALALVLGIIGGGAAAIIDMAKAHEATLALFLGIFFSLVLLSAGFFLILAMLSVAVYGLAHLAFEGSRAFAAFKGSFNYLSARPASMAFYGFLMFCYILIGFVVLLIGTPLALVPHVGSLLSMPFQVIVYIVQCYVSIVMLASSLAYYRRTAHPVLPEASIVPQDTSQEPVDEQVPPPEVKGETPQE